jgi:hypothetical protein
MTDVLKKVPAQSSAVLSLVLARGKSLEQIAQMLRMEPADVRTRAVAAVDQIAAASGSRQEPSAEVRSLIVEYLLGEQSVTERERTRSVLRSSPVARSWARTVARSLRSMASAPLPAIPDDGAPQARVRPVFAVAAFVILCGAVVAASVLFTGGGSSNTKGKVSARAAHSVRRITLIPAANDSQAFGAAAIIRQGNSLLLLLQAQGLAPNRRDSYAVWLFNTPVDSRLLGFVSPPVGPSGRFSSGVTLPDDAVRFHTLIVTRERRARPPSPGQMVLRAPLALS